MFSLCFCHIVCSIVLYLAALCWTSIGLPHHDVIKWEHVPRYWPFLRGIHRSPVNSPHKCQWRRALMFSLICAWINGWVNNRKAGYLRRNRAHYDITVKPLCVLLSLWRCHRQDAYIWFLTHLVIIIKLEVSIFNDPKAVLVCSHITLSHCLKALNI